jgi:Raf kinase inhibitor-like YbhB/YbcL family protein
MTGIWLGAGFLIAAVAGGRAGARLSVQSSSFRAGAAIPRKHTCDGDDVSPALSWSGAPEGTKELALLCEDPDAPGGTFVHWVLWGIPGGTTDLPEGVAAGDAVPGLAQARQGTNGFRIRGYRGPCPPPGKPHHYHFRVYALGARLDLPAGSTIERVRESMNGHVLAEGELIGIYGRDGSTARA